ncbi:uncharacterized protein METZ01_LOCUS354554, partial [marine metagenome]
MDCQPDYLVGTSLFRFWGSSQSPWFMAAMGSEGDGVIYAI